MTQSDVTYVTGLWDLSRPGRDFGSHYLHYFSQLLELDIALYIFADESLKDWVFERRSEKNTVFHGFSLDEIKHFYQDHWDATQKIRTDSEWQSQAEWLRQSPQATLEFYNPIVQSKLPWLNDVTFFDPFKSEEYFWIDAGITHTVRADLLSEVLGMPRSNRFIFLTYPHHGDSEIHGFDRTGMNQYCNMNFVDRISRGGFFGGDKFHINTLNGIYHELLKETQDAGYMGTEESIFTIMSYRHPEIIKTFELENGLLQPYFEDLRSHSLTQETILYIQTYNTPEQVRCLLESMNQYDPDLLKRPKVVLLDNSDDPEVEAGYQSLCGEFPFIERLKRDNPGITGGRVLAAEHFETTDAVQYLYFEDDMMLFDGHSTDRQGFPRRIDGLYQKLCKIMEAEGFDFLKLNFQELYAINTTNTAWFNVSQRVRQKAWPDTSSGPPYTQFDRIKSMYGLAYASGDIFYANWPHIMSRSANRRIFLDQKIQHPSEHNVMAHCYELWMQGDLNVAVLLASPIEHNRIHDYDRTARKEY
ncbi:MAG: WlaTC/HtrL family glycosyltransferase [Pseudomonadota bacterium]